MAQNWEEYLTKIIMKGKKIPWNEFAIYMCVENNWTRDLLKAKIKNDPKFREKIERYVVIEN